MRIDGTAWRTIWAEPDGSVGIIDQTELPWRLVTRRLADVRAAATAISTMQVRGAPLIGATAAWGMALAMADDSSDRGVETAHDLLLATRPTAVNLRWALARLREGLLPLAPDRRAPRARQEAALMAEEDVATCRAIGEHGAALIRAAHARTGRTVNVLTHCNAGWLATVDWGTALAPVYVAHDGGIPIHVWVDETRPRNQGAFLTAWELGRHGVPHTVIPDNAGGHLMQHGMVDLCIVGTDRTTRTGDVCNKIGTYLKALAAHDNGVPFYVGLPGSTIDWTLRDGVREIPIEQRAAAEVTHLAGARVVAEGSPVANYGFDVTPARYVTGLITERGIAPASEAGLAALYPELS
jgi:methylthioribose-1-phosphate isomerase